MSTDFWSEDDKPEPRRARGLRWWHGLGLGLIALIALFGLASAFFPHHVADRWVALQIRQLRSDILNGKFSPEELRDHLRTREGGHLLTLRLSQDHDPRVRAAVIQTLAGYGQPAEKREPGDDRLTGNTFSNPQVAESFGHLLGDSDPTVRKTAIRALCSLEEVRSFEEPMLRILESGPSEERLIVAESLAHWNGAAARRTIAGPNQAWEVRLAATHSANRYGWRLIVAPDTDFVEAMKQVQADANPELRQAATNALIHRRPERNR